MLKKILCASLLQGKIDFLRVERRANTYHAQGKPVYDANQYELQQACRWADEISISSEFPSAVYRWAVFPKVQKRYLTNIVKRDAARVVDVPGGARVTFKNIRDVVEEGVTKRYVSYIAVPEDEVDKIENEIFGKYVHKIRQITPLPVALCAALVQAERPQDTFMLIWIGENVTIMAIASPSGEVYVARHIPVGFSDEGIADPAYMERFSDQIRRDISSTSLFHTQAFPNVECQRYYLLGNIHLENIFSEFPIKELSDQIHFGLSVLPISGLQESDVTEAARITGSLFTVKEFNLVNPNILLNKNIEQGIKIASWAVAGMVIIAGAWLFRVQPVSSEKINLYQKKNTTYQELAKEVSEIQKYVNDLKRVRGWKTFYENTSKNQPAWDVFLLDIARSIPPNVVVDAFQASPGRSGKIPTWNALIKGHINNKTWNQGLELLRDFGAKLHSSPYFEVRDIDYTPVVDDKNPTIAQADFQFEINLILTPEDTADEK